MILRSRGGLLKMEIGQPLKWSDLVSMNGIHWTENPDGAELRICAMPFFSYVAKFERIA
jgi:hypothetical protein